MVVAPQRRQHNIANDVGVVGHLDANGIFNGIHRCQGMYAGAYSANTFDKGPGIARVAPLQNDLQSAEHGAAGNRVGDDILLINVHFTTHMAFNAGYGVHNQAATRIV